MTTYLLRLSLLLFLVLFPLVLPAAVVAPVAESPAVEWSSFSKAELEVQLGRKLKFKEKVGLWLMKKKLKRQAKRAKRAQKDARPVDGFAIVSFLMGLAGIFFIPAILAIIFGAISLGRFKRNPDFRKGKGFAIAGLVLGIGFFVFWIGWLISWNGGL